MSQGISCKCHSHKQPSWRETYWRVVQLLCNFSAFNGYHETASDYSGLRCLYCGAFWRTKAKYVHTLKQATREERFSLPLKDTPPKKRKRRCRSAK